MPQRSLVERIEILERNVESLQALPDRVAGVELQILQLREEIRLEFSDTREALRAEVRGGDEDTRRELREEARSIRDELRAEIRGGDEETRRELREEARSIRDELRAEIRAGDEDTRRELREEARSIRDELRAEIRAGDEDTRRELRDSVQQLLTVINDTNQDTRRYLQVIHEDVMSTLATLHEGRRPRKKK